MKASVRFVEGITVVDLSGRTKLDEGSSILRETVKGLLGKGQKNILLNLGDVSYIDSSGIGELVAAFTSVRNQGGEMKLLHLTKESAGSAADHEAVHRLRCAPLGRRSTGKFQVAIAQHSECKRDSAVIKNTSGCECKRDSAKPSRTRAAASASAIARSH